MIRETTIQQFGIDLFARKPTPGGGGVSALAGSLAACLGGMVANYTVGNKKYAAHEESAAEALQKLSILREELWDLADADEAAFLPLSNAYALPEETTGQAEEKKRVMETCLKEAALVPLSATAKILEAAKILSSLIGKSNRLVASDIGVGLALAHAAMQSAALNVYVNTKPMNDRSCAADYNRQCGENVAAERAIFEESFPVIESLVKS